MRFSRRLSVVFFLLLALFACQSVRAQGDIPITYTPPFVGIVAGVPFTAWSGAATQTFIFAVTPQSAVTLYLTNNGAAGHTITISTFATGSSNVADFSHNQSQWIPFSILNIASGASGSSLALTLGANSTTILGSGISNAAQLAVKLSAAGASADTLTMTAVLTPNGVSGQTRVAGVGQQGVSSGCPACFPVLVGGLDTSLNTNAPGVVGSPGGAGSGWQLAALTQPVSSFLSLSSNNILIGVPGNGGNGSVPIAVNQVSNSTQQLHINTATTTNIGGTHAELKKIIVGTPVASETITVKDGANTITVITLPATITAVYPPEYVFDYACNAGCSIVTSSTADLGVIFSQ